MGTDITIMLPFTVAGQAVQFGFDKDEANQYFMELGKSGLIFDINYARIFYDRIIEAAYKAKKKEGV